MKVKARIFLTIIPNSVSTEGENDVILLLYTAAKKLLLLNLHAISLPTNMLKSINIIT